MSRSGQAFSIAILASSFWAAQAAADQHKDCKVLESRRGGAAADYKFDVTNLNNSKTLICVKGQTLNQNAAIAACKNGEYDDMSDCKNW
jgi:hypothetical protein